MIHSSLYPGSRQRWRNLQFFQGCLEVVGTVVRFQVGNGVVTRLFVTSLETCLHDAVGVVMHHFLVEAQIHSA